MIELLAPAGSPDALRAAVEAGADAVYLAGSRFGARAYADNFDEDALTAAIRYAHLRGVRVHVTVNTMVLDQELAGVRDYLQFLEAAGADAALVQDLGVAKIAKAYAPSLPLHASTQMTIHNLAGAKAMQDLGFTRVVLSRELSLSEIAHIAQNVDIELETFTHGALCVCYSGQCLMSSVIGGRSGNRGRCAQPCRMQYTLVDGAGRDVLGDHAGKFLLSPKDLNTLDLLPQLQAAGVTSLKIEGRMKKPEYVATVVKTYRRVLDRGLATPADHAALAQIFNRDFTTAYLEGRPGRQMMSDRRPNNRGRLAGRILAYDKAARRAKLHLACELHDQDDLVIWVKVGGRVTTRVQDMQDAAGRPITHAEAGEDITLHLQNPVHPHDRVFKVYDVVLMAEAKKYFTSGAPIRRIPVTIAVTAKLGRPLTLTMTDADGHTVTAATDFCGEPAKNRPLTRATLEKHIDRLGTSIFSLQKFKCDIDDDVMFPVSEINKARQKAVEQLEEARLREFERENRISLEGAPAPHGDVRIDTTCKRPFPPQAVHLPLRRRLQSSEPAQAQSLSLGERTGAEQSAAPGAGPLQGLAIRTSFESAGAITKPSSLLVSVDSIDQMCAVLAAAPHAAILFGGDSYHHVALSVSHYEQATKLARAAGVPIYWNTPRILRDPHLPQVLPILDAAQDLAPDAFYVQNIGTLQLAKDHAPRVPIHTDTSLLAANRETLSFFWNAGVRSVTLAPELTLEQVQALARVAPDGLALEALVCGPIELMVSEFCPLGSYLGAADPQTSKPSKGKGQGSGQPCDAVASATGVTGCTMPCLRGDYALRDRKDIAFPIRCDQFCHMHLLNSRPLSMLPHLPTFKHAGIARLRIEGRSYAPEALAKIAANYARVLRMNEKEAEAKKEEIEQLEGKNFTRGHYFRGVADDAENHTHLY